MPTIKLFYPDPYLTAFSAVVTKTREHGGKPQVSLDRTAFYPEGGGQPFDTGRLIAGEDTREVLEVHESDGEIWHTLSAPLPTGETVQGELDWARRFDLMQQHSGEHILSGILHEMTGCENVGFHLSPENVYVDFDKPLTEEQLREAEDRANRYIWENHPVEISFPPPEALRTLTYRSKKELSGEVRIVAFPGADVCACCGTHVARSGEIGVVRVLTVQNWKGGVRVEMACGKRALSIARLWMADELAVTRLLSVKPGQALAAVGRLTDELSANRARIAALEERSFAEKAETLAGKGDVLLFEEGLSADGVRKLASLVTERCGGRCAVFSGNDADGYKYALGEKDGDLRSFTKELNASLSGRGGGKPFFTQGSVAAGRAEIERFFSQGEIR